LPRSKKPISEFELIKRLTSDLPLSKRTILGPGDDCALIARRQNPPLLLTIDSLVEGVHFRLKWCPPEVLGSRAIAVNLSDIAAMGGTPLAAVINLAVPFDLSSKFFERLYKGVRDAAARARMDVVGGNVTRAEALSITITILGELRGPSLRRDRARVGDAIFVTGTVGDAAVGLKILEGQIPAGGTNRRFLIGRFLSPSPRLEAGRRLARLMPTPAAIDISDGLLQDLGHILERSRVAAEIDTESIPLSTAYRTVIGDDPSIALGGGDDYELLFCLRTGLSDAALTARIGVPVRRIGRIVAGRQKVALRGRYSSPTTAGWDQLRVSHPSANGRRAR
jgi:thiamine-monophosphate kinase